MRCIGRNRDFARCRNNTKYFICKKHIVQLIIFLFITIPTAIASYFVICTPFTCSNPENNIIGKYYLKDNPNLYIEFFFDGKVYYSRDRETANYSINENSVIVSSHIFGSAKGELKGNSIIFAPCNNTWNIVGQAFQGTWQKK